MFKCSIFIYKGGKLKESIDGIFSNNAQAARYCIRMSVATDSVFYINPK